MTGVLLVNMGGPESPAEVKQFLRLMFLDKHIIPAPYIIRIFLSCYISTTRYKKSWSRYELIGGTPIKKNTNFLAQKLQSEIGDFYQVRVAYSYSEPFISSAFNEFSSQGISEITVIPLYPQSSTTTTSSVISDINKLKIKFPLLKIKIIPEFYKNEKFIKYWTDSIYSHITERKLIKPLLVFSAHSIPVSFIKKGDTYKIGIEESAKLIAKKSNLDYRVSFQSGMNSKTWIGPDTKTIVESLAKEGFNEFILIPISFVCENLETLYDLDNDIVPLMINKLNINISRVKIPVIQQSFIEMLKDLVII